MRTSIALVVLGLACVGVAAAQGDKKSGPGSSGTLEWQVMNRWVGTWKGESSGDTTDLLPRARHFRGVYTASWGLDNRFVIGKNASDKGEDAAIWLMNYDPRKKAYRMWFFDTAGESEWSGSWNDRTQTMTWQSTDSETGSAGRDMTRFVDKDHQEWHMEVKSRDGRVKKLQGKLERKS